ncbi:MAG: hypothetical protein KAG98_01900, partial [Lentisphaeria bacterium]|nr:hypothetical protein [Lentisphaeria bacterium]
THSKTKNQSLKHLKLWRLPAKTPNNPQKTSLVHIKAGGITQFRPPNAIILIKAESGFHPSQKLSWKCFPARLVFKIKSQKNKRRPVQK